MAKQRDSKKSVERPVRRTGLSTNDLYDKLKQMAVLYKIKPGEHVNEMELAQEFEVSRTPVREALNRLVAENLLTFQPNRGFYVRELETKEIFDLYELRRSIEMTALDLAISRATEKEFKELGAFWKKVLKQADKIPTTELVLLDEEFHLRLAALSKNAEITRTLQLINARIHFVRWVDLEERKHDVYDEHLELTQALIERDGVKALTILDTHISMRMEEVVKVIQAGVMKLYVR